MGRGLYTDAKKALEKKHNTRKKDKNEEIQEWREYWKDAGPIRFAEEVLPCWPENPPHPELGRVPDFNILNGEQKAFLDDLWHGTVNQFILVGARGSGKTYIVSMYTCWRVTCFDDFTLTIMGGASAQSMKLKSYVDYWRMNVPEIFYCVPRSVESVKEPPHVESRWNSKASFPACSSAATRGPRSRQVIVDEACTGESRSKDSAAAIKAAKYQLSSSPNPLYGLTSTAQFILGEFYSTWVNYKRLGFKRYRWSIARHIDPKWYILDSEGSPILDSYGNQTVNWDYVDEILSKDRNPDNWISNVWWVSDETIKVWRKGRATERAKTDDEWLVEILGGISKGTGLVFNREDLEAAICTGKKYTEDKSECELCEPYTDNCPMIKRLNLKPSMISNRSAGVDFGNISALTINGERGGMIYTLYSDERVMERSDEILNWTIEEIERLGGIYTIFCDPEERAMKDSLEDKGYSTPHIWKLGGGLKKRYYMKNYIRLIEQHKKFIPKKFTYLIESISQLSWDGKGDVIKRLDHSFDSDMYSCIDYDPDENSAEFWEATKDTEFKVWK